MIAVPSIALISLLAMLSMVAAVVLRKPWQQWMAVGCATLEVAAVIALIVVAHS